MQKIEVDSTSSNLQRLYKMSHPYLAVAMIAKVEQIMGVEVVPGAHTGQVQRLTMLT